MNALKVIIGILEKSGSLDDANVKATQRIVDRSVNLELKDYSIYLFRFDVGSEWITVDITDFGPTKYGEMPSDLFTGCSTNPFRIVKFLREYMRIVNEGGVLTEADIKCLWKP